MAKIKGLQTSKSGSQGVIAKGGGGMSIVQQLNVFGQVLNTFKGLMETASNERIRMEELHITLETVKTESFTRLKVEEEKTKQVFINAKLEYERIQAEVAIRNKELENDNTREENRHNERMAYLDKSDVDVKKQLDSMLSQIEEYRIFMRAWFEENKGKPGVDYTVFYNWMGQIGKFYDQAADLTRSFMQETK